jgi:RimJ/RimL family protein N-acetyltransferase
MNPLSVDEVRTARLLLTRMCESDLAVFCRMYRDPVVMATLGGVRSDDVTRDYLDKHLAHWRQFGFGWWVARELATGRFVGRGGLRHWMIDGRDEIEVGYGLMSEFWGQGLATELAAASVRTAFEALGHSELVCFTMPTNTASRHVMEKVGFRYERDMIILDLPHVLYRLTKLEWLATSGLHEAKRIAGH